MTFTYKVNFELDNLNRTVDFLVARNAFSRSREGNPIFEVMNQLIGATKEVISKKPLDKLLADFDSGVYYSVPSQPLVCFFVATFSTNNKLMTAPLATQHRDEEFQHVERIDTDDIALSGVKFEPRFFVQLRDPINIRPVITPVVD